MFYKKRIKALEEQIKGIYDRFYKIELTDGRQLYAWPSDAVLIYAPYIKAVQIGPKAENATQIILLVARLFGHNYRGIKFYNAEGVDISREMQQAFIDRGLDK